MNAHPRGLRGRNVRDSMTEPTSRVGSRRRGVRPRVRSLTFSLVANAVLAAWAGGDPIITPAPGRQITFFEA
jgi:hypothetical protein